MGLLALALAGAVCRAAAADVVNVNVIDSFESTDGMFYDQGHYLGLPRVVQPLVGAIDLNVTADGALRVDYAMSWKSFYGIVKVGRILPNLTALPCANASLLSLKYKVVAPQSRPGVGLFGVALLDSSDADLALRAREDLWSRTVTGREGVGNRWAEIYSSYQYAALDDASGEWRELRVGLCGDSSPFSPMMRQNTFGLAGNSALDRTHLSGYWIYFITAPSSAGEDTRGTILFDDMVCVEPEEPVDPCAVRSPGLLVDKVAGERIGGVSFDTSAASEVKVWGHQGCDEFCAARPSCLYYSVDSTFNGIALQFPTCYLYDALRREDVLSGETANAGVVVEFFWAAAPARRGALCDACACEGPRADCRGRDLATVPAAEGDVTTLDLSDNPRLAVVGPGAFVGLDVLESVILPADVVHVTPDALLALPALREVAVAAGANEPRNFVDASGATFFYDICCGRGTAVAGVAFCDLVPDVPGVVDAVYEDMDESTFQDVYGDLPVYVIYTPESPFLAEAAESIEKCAAICAMDVECLSFSNAPLLYDRGSCQLFAAAPAARPNASATVGTITHRTGLPPRTRAAQGAAVRAAPAVVDLTEANGYAGSFDVSLGATPLRGAVWVTPRLDAQRRGVGTEATFEPPRVALYDADTVVSIDVSVRGDDVTRDFTPFVVLDVEACDRAFIEDTPRVQLNVLAPPQSGSKSNRSARRLRRNLILAAIIIAAVLGALLLLWAIHRAVRFARKKAALEADRAMHVRQQVASAMQQVEEFQAAYATLPGNKFVDLKRLKPHETLRDDNLLIVYDSLQSVRAAMRREVTFVFVSHQWLAFDQPDPHGVHFASIKQAIRNVADENELPLSSIRVWVDIFSIPQKNRSEQRLAIASLPTFASACNYFVVVAPNTKHLDTGCDCDSKTYRKRAWCRAEIMSCWARNGTECMFVSTNQGLRSLADNEQVLLEALDVMDGDLTCCRLGRALCRNHGHARGEPCDREELMLPMLGLYTEIYRGRFGERKAAYTFVEPIKDKLYPKSFTYTYKDADGVEKSEEFVLFGDLVKAAELAVDLSVADPDDPLWRSGMPDLAPGTDAPRRSHHLRTNHAITAVHSKSLTLKRSLSTLVTTSTEPMRMPPRRLRSTHSIASHHSGDSTAPVPDRAGRPQLLRSMTWRASAPTLPGLDDDADGGDGDVAV